VGWFVTPSAGLFLTFFFLGFYGFSSTSDGFFFLPGDCGVPFIVDSDFVVCGDAPLLKPLRFLRVFFFSVYSPPPL